MRPSATPAPVPALLVLLLVVAAAPAQGQEWLCDSSYQDCRAPLLDLIHAERTGLDVAFPVMTDTRYAEAIIGRWTAGVPVRVLVDTRGVQDPAQAGILRRLREAGIPMRDRVAGGPLQWKAMLFAGQRMVQFGGADYTARAFVPVRPYVDHAGAVIVFTDDPALVDSFMTRYDDEWTSDAYAAHAGVGAPVARSHPTFDIAPALTFSSGADGGDASTARQSD